MNYRQERPRAATKLLLSSVIKAEPAQNFELKKLYENENLKINEHSAELQGPLLYPSKSFADNENLVRLSLKVFTIFIVFSYSNHDILLQARRVNRCWYCCWRTSGHRGHCGRRGL